MKSPGLQNRVGKYFFCTVQDIPKVLAYCKDQTPCCFKCLSTVPNGRFVIEKIYLGDKDFFLALFMLYVIPDDKLCLHKIYVQILSLELKRPKL